MPPLAAPLDFTRSAHTGYTRGHWLEILTALIRGVLPHIDPVTALPQFPDPREPALAGLLRNPGGPEEAFDRTHLLMAIYIAATGSATIDGTDIAELYRRGIDRLYDPQRNLHFPPRSNPAASALAMLLAPREFLDGLSAQTRANLAAHLQKFIHRSTRDSNIMLFSMMPAAVLERLGADYDRSMLDDYFDRILSMYRGGGWFIDGWNRGFDFYNFWGFQLYLHALVHYDARWRERYAERVREITAAHEQTLPLWFGKDGAPIAKGRSLNYRFAALSGIGYAQLSGLSSLDPGLARRIASGCVKYFFEHGCISDRGLLEVGYHGPNAALGEDYSDRGAPFWASTGLVALALPETHPFWTAAEKPFPADETGIKRHRAAGAQMLLKVDGGRGEARALVAGEPFLHRNIWQAGTKYFQHAYSSSLGFALTGEGGSPLAAGRTGLSVDGKIWAYRTWPRVLSLDESARFARSEWDAWAALEGSTGTVITESHFLDQGEVHIFRHTADGPRHLCLGGWAIQIPHGPSNSPLKAEATNSRLVLTSATMWSTLQLLHPLDTPGEIVMEQVLPKAGFHHAHLFGGSAAYPLWRSLRPVPAHTPIAIFVDAGRLPDSPHPKPSPVRARMQAGQVILEPMTVFSEPRP